MLDMYGTKIDYTEWISVHPQIVGSGEYFPLFEQTEGYGLSVHPHDVWQVQSQFVLETNTVQGIGTEVECHGRFLGVRRH